MAKEQFEIEGQKIVKIRPMTPVEQKVEYWHKPATVIILENGVRLYASQDSEGNGPGTIFGRSPCGSHFGLH